MRICHVSDNHGQFVKLIGSFDIVVLSGDFLPDPPSYPVMRQEYQLKWLEKNILIFKEWLNDKPFLFIPGNHDWWVPDLLEYMLRSYNIKAFNLHEKIVSFNGINFYGFPYVMPINGSFNYEGWSGVMEPAIDKMVDALNSTYVDVLVSHAPPYGCLDMAHNGNRYGNTYLANALDYRIKQDMLPQYLLCGHIHSGKAVTLRNGVLVSNAATGQNLIECL